MSRFTEMPGTDGGWLIISDDGAGNFAICTAEDGEAASVTLTIHDMRRIVGAFPEFVLPAAPKEKP